MRLFLAGARGYLDVCIEQRDLSALFARGDGPPGFELIMRRRQLRSGPAEHRVLRPQRRAADEAVAIVMTGALMLAVAEVSLARRHRARPGRWPTG